MTYFEYFKNSANVNELAQFIANEIEFAIDVYEVSRDSSEKFPESVFDFMQYHFGGFLKKAENALESEISEWKEHPVKVHVGEARMKNGFYSYYESFSRLSLNKVSEVILEIFEFVSFVESASDKKFDKKELIKQILKLRYSEDFLSGLACASCEALEDEPESVAQTKSFFEEYGEDLVNVFEKYKVFKSDKE